jgi:hypothetical protein
MADHHFAGHSGLHASAGTLKQLDAQLAFKFLQQACRSGLRDVDALRGLAQASRVVQRDDQSELPGFQACFTLRGG